MKNSAFRFFFYKCALMVCCVVFGVSFSERAEAAAGDLDQSFGIQGRRIKTVPNSQPVQGHDFFSYDIVVQPDGKILIAGYAFDSNLGDSMVIARYNANGTLDSGFANGGIFRYEHGNVYSTDKLHGIALQPDGKIVAAGRVTVGNGDPAFAVIRLNPNGTFDSSFGTNGIVVKNFFSSIDEATEVAIQADGKILVSGWVTQGGVNNGSTYDFTVVRYNPNGTEDTSFGDGGVVFTDFLGGRGDIAQTSVLQPDGKLVVAGWISVPGSQYDFGLARYNTNGTLDTTFDGDGKVVTPVGNNQSELLRGIALAPGGKIVATGDMYNPPIPGGSSGHYDIVVVRYNPDGSLDQSFDGDGKFVYDSNLGDRNESGEDTIVQPDGKILIAGQSHLRQEPGVSHVDMLLMRINANGSLDNSFGSGGITLTDFGIFAQPPTTNRSGDKGSAITLQPDGKIVVAGDSYFAGDTTELLGSFNNRLAVARFENDIGPLVTRRPAFDFDGDGRADIGVFRQGNWYIQQSQAGFAAFQFGISTDKLMPADYDGDGRTDAAVYRDGTWYLLRSAQGFTAVQFGLASDVPQTGDFDGDGRADLAVFRPADGTWYLMRSTAGFTAVQFGQNGDKPVASDFDGDGKTDLGVYRDGTWYVLQSRDGFRAIQFGIASDRAVAADYDGDGKSDFAVFRDGTWYLQRSQSGFAAIQFGQAGDIPAPADYDGDGKTDFAVFRGGTWYLQQSTSGFAGAQFGLANDVPISSASAP